MKDMSDSELLIIHVYNYITKYTKYMYVYKNLICEKILQHFKLLFKLFIHTLFVLLFQMILTKIFQSYFNYSFTCEIKIKTIIL